MVGWCVHGCAARTGAALCIATTCLQLPVGDGQPAADDRQAIADVLVPASGHAVSLVAAALVSTPGRRHKFRHLHWLPGAAHGAVRTVPADGLALRALCRRGWPLDWHLLPFRTTAARDAAQA